MTVVLGILAPVSDDPRIGSILDRRYKIVECIASGGMGLVYRAERVQLGRVVAIKFLHEQSAANPDARKRFEVEAQVMARLDHPNCAGVIDFGVDEGVPYVVMDLVSGETLRTILDRGRLDSQRAVDIMRQVLSGLAHAHEQGVIHRDIKPGNVMVGAATGVGTQVRILDFGLARLGAAGDARLTAAGATIGTPAYMAPEQCLARDVDARTDLYACGVLLFEMLTGHKPFHSDDAMEVMEMHLKAVPPSLGVMVPEPFGDLERIVARALAKEPDARFQSAVEFASALEKARYPGYAMSGLGVPPAQAWPGNLPRMAQASRRAILVVALSALFLLVIILAVTSSNQATAPVLGSDGGVDAELIEEAFELEEDLEARIPDLPGIAEAKELLALGRKDGAIRHLIKLEKEHPDNAEVLYLLGRLYFDKLWWSDGLDAYRRAIALEPRYRTYPPLIKSALEGFIVAPDHHQGIADFLRNDIGEPALPFLQEAASSHPKKKIRERAQAELERY